MLADRQTDTQTDGLITILPGCLQLLEILEILESTGFGTPENTGNLLKFN